MAKLTLIRGLPGSGKSTLAEALIKAGVVDQHFENDDYFLDENGFYKYDSAYVKEAAEHCQERTKSALERGERVVVANTFSREFEAEVYFCMLEKRTDLQILMCFGQWENHHGVPDEKLLILRDRWEWF